MKKIIWGIVIFYLTVQLSVAQIIHNNKIDSVLNFVSLQSISKMNKELSGDTITTIGGISQIKELFPSFPLYPVIVNLRVEQAFLSV